MTSNASSRNSKFSAYDLDSLNTEEEEGIYDYPIHEYEEGAEKAWSSDWGFSDEETSVFDGNTESRGRRNLNIDQYISEFENDSNYGQEYISLSPSGTYSDEFTFEPEIIINKSPTTDNNEND